MLQSSKSDASDVAEKGIRGSMDQSKQPTEPPNHQKNAINLSPAAHPQGNQFLDMQHLRSIQKLSIARFPHACYSTRSSSIIFHP
jgi:hypothetical protein